MQNRLKTYTGKYFYLPNEKEGTDGPRPYDIRDIAHALSMMCRYNGHCNKFYSVAEHCVYVSQISDYPKEALLHDLSEAYMADITTGIKPLLENYFKLEDVVMKDGFEHFGLEYPQHENVGFCDKAILVFAELKVLFPGQEVSIGDPAQSNIPLHIQESASKIKIKCMLPEEAEQFFLNRFSDLFNPQPFFFPIVSTEVLKNIQANLAQEMADEMDEKLTADVSL